MNQLQSRAADTSTSYKMLLAIYLHFVYKNSLPAVILNMRIYLSNSFMHIKEYHDYRKIKKITYDLVIILIVSAPMWEIKYYSLAYFPYGLWNTMFGNPILLGF